MGPPSSVDRATHQGIVSKTFRARFGLTVYHSNAETVCVPGSRCGEKRSVVSRMGWGSIHLPFQQAITSSFAIIEGAETYKAPIVLPNTKSCSGMAPGA